MLTGARLVKTRLLAEGLRVAPEARRELSDPALATGPLTLADYATTSGVTLVLSDSVWVNAPLPAYNPNFVTSPRCELDWRDGGFLVRAQDLEVPAQVVPVPAYHDKLNRWGERVTSYAITHSDRVRISPIEGCAWACQYCGSSYEFRYRRKSLEGLVDSVATALVDPILPARHVAISGGTPRSDDFDYENEVYDAVASAFPGTEVDVMMAPVPGLLDPERLKATGIRGLAVNLELYNEDIARRLMHAKWKLGRAVVLDFIERAAGTFGAGGVRSLLVVGLEPMEDSLKAVTALAERGCDPVLSPFRPDLATPLRDYPPPTVAFLVELYERSVEIVARYGVQLGPRCIPCQHNTLTFPG